MYRTSRVLLAVTAAFWFMPSVILAGTVFATGEGWCSAYVGGCNNANTAVFANTLAGGDYAGDPDIRSRVYYHDWFSFTIPFGNISNAAIDIWNDSSNSFFNPDPIYHLHPATSINYTGLIAGGTSFGSVALPVADTGNSHYVTILLNATGIAFLSANAGSQVIFGGEVTGTSGRGDNIFGGTDGTPVAYLDLNDPDLSGPNEVIEPDAWTLLGSGLFALGLAIRRGKLQARRTSQ